ncbi:Signal recognition particle [Echinococcus granulosus]|uniref:Signal recognition particle 9 kDa protein n=1 Tax=Echinococcus granulosus TaxID=6210 RepID=W6UZM6_ECHGR|nr:Signal recognition particle [Echinococcus granulosus]EUB63967.1 Signal recognition particle [Echinococcus granulosus]
MTLYATWEDFAKDAEMLYSKDPMGFRLVTKYRHKDQKLVVKASDNQNTLKYVAELAQDVKKYERFTTLLMRHMSSK